MWDGLFLRYDTAIAYVEEFFVKGTRWSAQLREKAHYDRSSKVLTRQTAGTLIATLDSERHFPLNTVHVHFPKEGQTEITNEMLIGILNSSLLRFIYKVKSEETGKVFPQVHISRLRELPLPINPSADRLTQLHGLVKHMIESGASADEIEAVDHTVFELYGIEPGDQLRVIEAFRN
jgi:hypothetical protein